MVSVLGLVVEIRYLVLVMYSMLGPELQKVKMRRSAQDVSAHVEWPGYLHLRKCDASSSDLSQTQTAARTRRRLFRQDPVDCR